MAGAIFTKMKIVSPVPRWRYPIFINTICSLCFRMSVDSICPFVHRYCLHINIRFPVEFRFAKILHDSVISRDKLPISRNSVFREMVISQNETELREMGLFYENGEVKRQNDNSESCLICKYTFKSSDFLFRNDSIQNSDSFFVS